MKPFTRLDGLVAPLDRANVDTDAIIPKQFLKSVKRSGFGLNLFDEWRYLDHGEPGMDHATRPLNPDFILNQARYQDASILLTRENFGCGSSREHAPWALADFGIRCLIGPSFADIFYNNCFKNGLLPVVISPEMVQDLFQQVVRQPGYRIRVDLPGQLIQLPGGQAIGFEVEPFRKHCLVNGLDDIGLTLEKTEAIQQYEQRRRKETPWLFA